MTEREDFIWTAAPAVADDALGRRMRMAATMALVTTSVVIGILIGRGSIGFSTASEAQPKASATPVTSNSRNLSSDARARPRARPAAISAPPPRSSP